MSTISHKQDPQQTIAEMRFVSNSTGLVYEAQIEQLKKLANLFFDPEVATISISPETRFAKVDSTGVQNTLTDRFPEAVQFVLGDSWTVQMCYNEQSEPSGPRKQSKKKVKAKKWKGKKKSSR